MSDIEATEEVEEAQENSVETVPDIFTVAEAGQLIESDVGATDEIEHQEKSYIPEYEIPTPLVHFRSGIQGFSWPVSEVRKDEEGTRPVYVNAFTQTFFKFMKNLSDKRFAEIINMTVDHEDKSLFFYRPSTDFILEDFVPRDSHFYLRA